MPMGTVAKTICPSPSVGGHNTVQSSTCKNTKRKHIIEGFQLQIMYH